MNPWYLLALIAGAIGVGTLASSSAKAAMPRVTNWALNILPRPGTGQWDLWVTGLNGLVGPAMLALVPDHQMIYIPAAKAMSQPLTGDWIYTFTPVGSATPFSIVVPAAVLQAYAAAPKTQALKASVASHAYGTQQGAALAQTAFVQQLIAEQLAAQQPPPPPTAAQDINALIQQVKQILSSVPSDGSDATAYGVWLATTALQVPGIISQVQQAITAIQNNTAQGDLVTLEQLLPQIVNVVAKVSAAAASAPSSGSGTSPQATVTLSGS